MRGIRFVPVPVHFNIFLQKYLKIASHVKLSVPMHMNNESCFTPRQWCGVIHLHSTYSDGQLDISSIIDSAREVGLDYIVMTDHRTLDARRDGYERFHGDLAVCVGYEHNDAQNLNHYLVLGPEEVFDRCEPPQAYIDWARRQNAVGIIAHPMEKRNYFKRFPPYPWTDWGVSRFDAMEIWNQMSNWLEHITGWYSFIRILFPRRFNAGSPPALLDLWDRLNRRRFVSATGGVDFHTRRFRFGFLSYSFFPIKVALQSIRTHVYLEPFEKEVGFPRVRQQLYEALRHGNGFISNFRRGDARGSLFFVEDADGGVFGPGLHQKPYRLPAYLNVRLPGKGTISLVRNGRVMETRKASRAEFRILERGVYRIEVRRGRYIWIYTNPFPAGPYPI